MLTYLVAIIKSLLFFKASYSNNVFPEPLSEEEEEKYIDLLLKKIKKLVIF